MRAVRFVAVGELLVDVIAAGAGHAARIRVRPAGSAFNAAVAAAAAGAEATRDRDGRRRPRRADDRRRAGGAGRARRGDGRRRARPGRSCSPTGRSGSTAALATTSSLPRRIEADAVLVSGYVPAAAAALERAEAHWVALDAARLEEPPPGGNAVIVNEGRLTEDPEYASALAEGRRLAWSRSARTGAVAVAGDRVERVRAGAVGGGRAGLRRRLRRDAARRARAGRRPAGALGSRMRGPL